MIQKKHFYRPPTAFYGEPKTRDKETTTQPLHCLQHFTINMAETNVNFTDDHFRRYLTQNQLSTIFE